MAKSNLISLRPAELKELIKQRWRNRHIKTRPIYIEGHKGVGKTDIIRQCAAELSAETGLNVECRTLNLQFCEPPDFLGLPIVEKDPETGEPVTIHARPQLLPTTGYGLWFFDEGNRCNRDNRAGLLTILQDRNVNGHPLGAGWVNILAGNPIEADGVTYEVQEFDAALEDRITKVEFKGDVEGYIKHMIALHGERDPVVRWIMSQNDVVDFKGKTRTSPRGLDYLANAIKASGGYVNNPMIFQVIAAEVGLDAAHTFQKFLTSPESISAEEVVDTFSVETENKLKRLEELGRNDVLNTLVEGIATILATREKITKKNYQNVQQYLELVNAESKATFFISLGDKENTKVYEEVVEHIIAHSPKVVGFLRETQERNKKAAK